MANSNQKTNKKINILSKKKKCLYYFLGFVLALGFYWFFFYNRSGYEIIWKVAYYIMYGNNNMEWDFNVMDDSMVFLLILIPLIIFIILFFIFDNNKKYKLIFWGFFSVPILFFIYYCIMIILWGKGLT